MKKILIVGKGFLGSELFSQATIHNYEIISTNVSKNVKLDITKYEEVQNFINKFQPEIIVNCAAFSNVDEMETHPKKGYEINALGPKNLSKICNKKNIYLIHISTDSVFDGEKGNYSEKDLPNPVNQYAMSKIEGEKNVLNNSNNALIIRTNFYGYDKNQKFLFNWILNNLKNKKTFNTFSDVIFNPLSVSDLANLILELIKKPHFGILHLAHDEKFSKYDFSLIIARELNFDETLIKNTKIEDSNLIAKRPKNTTLNNYQMKKLIDYKPKSLTDWVILNNDKFKTF